MKKQRNNRAKRSVMQPKFRARIEKPAKGAGSYERKPKHPSKRPAQPEGDST